MGGGMVDDLRPSFALGATSGRGVVVDGMDEGQWSSLRLWGCGCPCGGVWWCDSMDSYSDPPSAWLSLSAGLIGETVSFRGV